jgi:membrane dipeptidase
MHTWFDAHLDLTCLAVRGRDMLARLDQINGDNAKRAVGPWPPAGLTLPSLREGGVHQVLGTIFTETNGDGLEGFPEGDADAAHEAGLRQLRIYHNWRHDAGIVLTRFDGTEQLGEAQTDGEPERAYSARTPTHTDAPIQLAILIENADPIRSPDELPWWKERGVIAVGMAWWTPSRYAGGNGTDIGLTHLGRALADAMDDLRIIHDLSHLSQKATEELLSHTDRPVMASHSNCRALLGGEKNESWQRHLSDETIKEIGSRGGVIGLNLVRNFLTFRPDDPKQERARPTVDDALAHLDHICDITGSRAHVGLGSDMDGGISATDLCEGVESPSDYEKLAAGLEARGWSEDEIAGFTHENWRRFLAEAQA